MPAYQLADGPYDVSRDITLLDTNVLVSFFLKHDRWHAAAEDFFREYESPLYVTVSVLVETWGVLVGSFRDWTSGLALLGWVNTPGNATLLPETACGFDQVYEAVWEKRVDVVDALLVRLANDVTIDCSLNPPVLVATFDTSDFTKFYPSLRFRLLDLRSNDIVSM